MRSYVTMLQQQLRATTLYVTHDQTEAMTMGHRVAVLRDGKVQQCDDPQKLYEQPANEIVAGFIGSPAMNLVRSRLGIEKDGAARVMLGDTSLRLSPALLARHSGLMERPDREVVVGIRPEDIEDAEIATYGEHGATLDATVALAEPMGAELIVHFPLSAQAAQDSAAVAALATLDSDTDALSLVGSGEAGQGRFTARLSPRSRARTGQPLRFAIDLERLHFFDASTGNAI